MVFQRVVSHTGGFYYDHYWSLLCNAILCEQTHCAHVKCDTEWVTVSLCSTHFQYSLRWCTNSTVWMWNCVHHSTIHQFTVSLYSIYRAYVYLAITCHLHFWQNDQGLSRATAVTWGWNRYWSDSQHRKLTLETKILPPLLQGLKLETFQSGVWHSKKWAIPTPRWFFTGWWSFKSGPTVWVSSHYPFPQKLCLKHGPWMTDAGLGSGLDLPLWLATIITWTYYWHVSIGQFSEAGFLEWTPFIIFRSRSHKRSQLPLPGQFRSMCCIMLCITMEAEPRIARHNKCHYCCICKNYRGKVMEDGQKKVSASFFSWAESCELVKKCVCFCSL